MFADTSVIDRRKTSSYGYRAVHVVVRHEGRQVEVQVRTELQHQWAEFSEKLADIRGHAIKYGGGDAESRALLDLMSLAVSAHEQMEMTITALPDGQTKKEQMAQYNQRRQQLLTGLSRLKESITAGGTTR